MSARVAISLKLNLYQRSKHTERNPAWITIDIPHGLPWIKTVPVFERSHGSSMPMILDTAKIWRLLLSVQQINNLFEHKR